jgi:hypothetical protein
LAEVLNMPAVGFPGLVVLPVRPIVVSKEPLVTRFACAENAIPEKLMAESTIFADLRKVSLLFTMFPLEVLRAMGGVSNGIRPRFPRVGSSSGVTAR